MVWSQPNDAFVRGNDFYNQGQFVEALEQYQSIIDQGSHSAELYFNMGNAHYKLNHVAESVFYYEKALQLDPKNQNILNNLTFAQNMTIDAFDTLPENQLQSFFESVTSKLQSDQWSGVTIGFVWLSALFFLAYFFWQKSFYKRSFFVVFVLAALLAMISFGLTLNRQANEKRVFAIVFEKTSFRNEPNLRSEQLFDLNLGTKVEVKQSLNAWTQVLLSDGTLGWTPTTALREIE